MILVDTSVWVDHLRRGNPALRDLLDQGTLLAHPLVIGELVCGSMRDRREFLLLLFALPQALVAEDEEVFRLIERHKLHGRGLGWVDMHLLASARLSGSPLWTLDKRLEKIASILAVSA